MIEQQEGDVAKSGGSCRSLLITNDCRC